jgi:hypothetical protein
VFVVLRLLKNFALHNGTNQNILLKHVEFYMSQMGVKLKAADTLAEIFRDNRQVCSQIEEKTIRHFVTIISERGQFPRYLQFFRIITMPEGRPLKRNQDLILKLMLEKDESVFIFFNDSEGRRQRQELIKANDHIKNEEGILNFHIVQLQLLTDLVAGQNHMAEVKCQSMLPLSDCVEHIIEKGLPWFIKAPWLEFIRECYLETEKPFDFSQHGQTMWEIASEAVSGLNQPDSLTCPQYVNAVSSFITSFYSRMTSSRDSDPSAHSSTITFAETLAQQLKTSENRTFKEEFSKALASIKASRISEREITKILSTVTLVKPMVIEKKAPRASIDDNGKEYRIKRAFQLFQNQFAEKMGLTNDTGSVEYNRLIEIFTDDVSVFPSYFWNLNLHLWYLLVSYLNGSDNQHLCPFFVA